ncbi:MAG: hypothetical protein C0594_08365 [Marinilabiliales bacterium]|nr:MAG: hypothetical protein C0594_08365 [Marinilabiliales bacterium]
MKSHDLLRKALEELDNMSQEEVQARSEELGIVIPEEPKISELMSNFVFDLKGFFKEIVNSKHTWYDNEFSKRQSISVKQPKMSHSKVAHSFYTPIFS